MLQCCSGTLYNESIVELEQTGAHFRNDAGSFVNHFFDYGQTINVSTLMVKTSVLDIPAISSNDCTAIKISLKRARCK